MTPYELFRTQVGADPARPFITFYDDAGGERVELSLTTFDNWVAKTAGLLRDGLAVEPGERVGLALPVHWQAPVVLMACWAVGAVTVPLAPGSPVGGRPAEPLDVAFAAPEALEDVLGLEVRDVIGMSLRPLSGPLQREVAGVLDYALEVPAYPDRFTADHPPAPDELAAVLPGKRLTGAELVSEATAWADTAGWPAGARVLSTHALTTMTGIHASLLAPLAVGGSVVLCRNLDPAALAGRCTAERVSQVFD